MPGSPPPDAATIVAAMRYRNAPAAIEWLCQAFGFKKHRVVPGQGTMIDHAELSFGRAMIMLGSARNDAFGRMISIPGEIAGIATQSVYAVVADVDAHYAAAVAAGAKIVMEIEDKGYGGRGYTC